MLEDLCLVSSLCHRWRLFGMLRSSLPVGMVSTTKNLEGIPNFTYHASSDRKKALSGRALWVLTKPLPEEVVEPTQCFPEVAELLKEEVRVETKGWTAKGPVARSLSRRVSVEVVVHEFWQRAGLKGKVAAFNLEQGFLLFQFQEAGERDLVLGRPWVVAVQALVVKPWWP